jgi:hypothetical protein
VKYGTDRSSSSVNIVHPGCVHQGWEGTATRNLACIRDRQGRLTCERFRDTWPQCSDIHKKRIECDKHTQNSTS